MLTYLYVSSALRQGSRGYFAKFVLNVRMDASLRRVTTLDYSPPLIGDIGGKIKKTPVCGVLKVG